MFKNKLFLILVFSLLTSNGFSGAALSQIQSFNCDFDDNIFVTDAKIKIWDSVNNKEFSVSTADWALVRGLLGKEGPLKTFVIKQDGLTEFEDSGPDGINTFKKEIENALGHKDESWKGPSWNAFVEALSRPLTQKYTSIITARRHSPTAIMLGLKVLKDRGLIKSLPEISNLYSVGWSEFPKEFKGANDSESKSNVMKFELDQEEKVPVPEDAKLLENQEGTGKAKLHLWGFSDDDYGNFSTAVDMLSKEVGKGRWPHIKVVVFYTGLNNPDQKPHTVVLKPDGTSRPADPSENSRKLVLRRLQSPEKAKARLQALLKELTRHP